MERYLGSVFLAVTVIWGVGSASAETISQAAFRDAQPTRYGVGASDQKIVLTLDGQCAQNCLSPTEELQEFKIDLLAQLIEEVTNLDPQDFDPSGKPRQWEKIVYASGYSLCPDSPEKLCQDYLTSLSLPTKMDHWWIKVSGQLPSIPEPGTGLLVGAGFVLLALRRNTALQARR